MAKPRIEKVKSEVEYPALWAYLRHIETLRQTFVGGLIAIVGVLVGIAFKGADRFEDIQTDIDLATLSTALGLLFFGQFFLLTQKRVYNRYRRAVDERDRLVIGESERIKPFEAYYLLVVAVIAGLSVLVCYSADMDRGSFVLFTAGQVAFSLYLYWKLVGRAEAALARSARNASQRPPPSEAT